MSYLVVLAIGIIGGAYGMFYAVRKGYIKVRSN
jgi:hypothetical protein